MDLVRSRRDVLKTLAGAAAGVLAVRARVVAGQVKYSGGTKPPSLKAPPGATDTHIHLYDSRFPPDPKAALRPPDALAEDYRAFQRRIGTSRVVVVQPSTYGVDNRCTEAALAAFGPSARAVAVVNTSVTEPELRRLNDLGVRGIRFNLAQAGATTPEMIEPLARRVASLGWHLQVNANPDTLMAIMPTLERVPTDVVFDHLAHVPQPEGVTHPLFARVRALLERRHAWVKLSGAYQDTRVGPPSYRDTSAVARAYVVAAPDRVVWGSDWPHPTSQANPPDDAVLFDLLTDWAPDQAVRHRILVDNPARLYGFETAVPR